MSDIGDPYPFEGEDGDEIAELNLEDLDQFGEERVTVGMLVGETESWRFGHVIVDEAQDLTPMQWRMVMRRVRGRSLTIVGDLAQRSIGETGAWADHLPTELAEIERLDLTINYRSPAEIHALAISVLADYAPGIAPSRSIRTSGFEPEFVATADRAQSLTDSVTRLLGEVAGQIAVVSVDESIVVEPHDRVQLLTPGQAKGLEFDAVVLDEPAVMLAGSGGAALLYIALTRATQRLIVVHQDPLPAVLTP